MSYSTARSAFAAPSGVRSRGPGGFSLVELLVVLGIVAILIGLSAPTLLNLGRSQELSNGGQIIHDLVQMARQTAITRNRAVQFRFYQAPEAGSPAGNFNAVQVAFDDPPSAISKLIRLPNQIIITPGSDVSSLLELTAGQTNGQDAAGPYVAFRFRPDGSSDLSPAAAYTATLVRATDPKSGGNLPPNFFTLQLDPVTGRVTTYHP